MVSGLNSRITRPSLIVAVAISLYFLYILLVNKLTLGRYLLYVAITFVAITTIEVIITLAIRRLKNQQWNNIRMRFELVFGWPMSANREYIQAAVDSELTRRAQRLWGVCEQQAQLTKATSADADVTLAEFINLGDVIKDLKQIFWDAHALAIAGHFSAKKSFKDYLEKSGTRA